MAEEYSFIKSTTYNPSDIKEERIITSERLDFDDAENVLRPKKLEDYVGQNKVKENLKVFMHSAQKRKETLDHVLLYGPPGLGKTTLSHIIASEMHASIRATTGPAIERAGDLAAILTNMQKGDVLFIDEIHRLNPTVEEILYSAMEDSALDIVTGKGKEELAQIINRSAKILNIDIKRDAAEEIARRSRGTPRIANRLLRRVRDFTEYDNMDTITLTQSKKALKLLEIDELGLDKTDAGIVKTIIEKFSGGPVGLDTLAAASGEDSNTIEDVYEPYLLQLGFIARTPRGRVCLKGAYEHLGIRMSEKQRSQLSMFNED